MPDIAFYKQGEFNALAIIQQTRRNASVIRGDWYAMGNITSYVIGLRGHSAFSGFVRITDITKAQTREYARLWRAGFYRSYGYHIPFSIEVYL